MSQAITLARPYARAAFELAQGTDELDAWSAALAFGGAVARDDRVVALAGDPGVRADQLVGLHLASDMPADSAFASFLDAMARERRMALLPEVAELFEGYRRESQSQLLVKVTSAIALDAAQTQQLKDSLKRRFKREIELETTVDEALMAGVVIDTGSEVIDGSARGRLARLSSALMH